MTVWLLCLPVLLVAALATRVALRTRSGTALRAFAGVNVVLLALAVAAVAVAVNADPVSASAVSSAATQ